MSEFAGNITPLSIMIMGMSLTTLTGIGASIFSTASMLPQLFKIIKDKKAGAISTWMLFFLLIGISLWVYYGILVNDLIIIISNAVSVVINLLIIVYSLKYKEKGAG